MRNAIQMLGMVMLVVALSGACQTMTGRTAGQWTDDKGTTARAKTALAATELQTLTRVDVDTVDGVVYLRGKVESAAVKNRASEVVRATTGARVVNDLMVDATVAGDREATPSASPTSR